jgi:hypothetical protein
LKAKTIIGSWLALTMLAACASSTAVHVKSSAPLSGEGTLKVTMKDEKHTTIDLRMTDLEKPSSIGASVYVAWAVPAISQNITPMKIGAFQRNDDASGNFEATVPLTDFYLVVTAEHSDEVRFPSGGAVLSAEIRREPASDAT